MNEPESGIIPRGMVYEDGKGGAPGSIVVGINPGKSRESERQHFLDHDKTYYMPRRNTQETLIAMKKQVLDSCIARKRSAWTALSC